VEIKSMELKKELKEKFFAFSTNPQELKTFETWARWYRRRKEGGNPKMLFVQPSTSASSADQKEKLSN
jgi:hypothetical protein